MKTLSGLDGTFLHLETPETPMHVASLHLFDLPAGYSGDFHTDIKRHLAARLHLAPIFQRKLAPMPLQFANPVWVHDDHVDIDHHVQRITLAPPGTMTQFDDCAARLHGELLDRHRPLWRVAVIDGLASGQVGYYVKVHHAVLDGQAGVLLAQALFDLSANPGPMARPGRRPASANSGMGELAAAALKHDAGQYIKLLRHLPEVVRTLAGLFTGPQQAVPLSSNFSFGPKTPLNVPITARRGFAGLSVPMDRLKAIAITHEAKLNDVVLALCSGTLRRYLAGHGGMPKKPLIAAMPISLRDAGNTEFSTQATMALVSLHTDIADPLRRLRAIRDGAGAVKALAQRSKAVLPTDFPTIGMPWLMHGLASLYGRSRLANKVVPLANVVVSNVPGPQVPLYAAGARMATYWPLSIVEHGLGLNITVMSYAGAMGFGFTTAHVAVPDAQELVLALREALEELERASAPKRRGVAKVATKQATKKAAKKATPVALPVPVRRHRAAAP
jgi:diacylglycerol O-acyltransferase / wax synthase